MTWTTIEQTNQISQSMCMLGTINMVDQNNDNEITNADIILYSGESADSQVIAVKRFFFSVCNIFFNIYLCII